MGNVGGGEILVILLVALIVLGPQRLPEVARQVGKAVGEFRKMSSGFQRELRSAMDAETGPTPQAQGPTVPDPSPAVAEIPGPTVEPAGEHSPATTAVPPEPENMP